MRHDTYLHKALDLSGPPTPIDWIVEGFAAAGLLTLVAGQPGTAKTQLGLQIVEAIAQGGTVCGMTAATGHALYLDAENGETILRDRQDKGGLQLPPGSCLDMRGESLHTVDARQRLAATILEVKASLVVLDSLTRLRGPLKENDTDDMASLIGELASVGRQTNAAIILLHHRSTKSSAASTRGASAIEDQSDIIFTLSRNGHRRTLANTKMRPAPEWTHKLSIDLQPDPLRLVLEDEGDGDAGRIRACIGDGATFAEIGAALGIDTGDEVARKRLTRALNKMSDVDRVSQGRYALRDVPTSTE